MWFLGSILGSTLLVILNTLTKLWGFSVLNVLTISALSCVTTYCYWYAFKHSDHFLMCWFVNSALVSVGAFISNKFVIKQALSSYQIIGILLIILGALLLKK